MKTLHHILGTKSDSFIVSSYNSANHFKKHHQSKDGLKYKFYKKSCKNILAQVQSGLSLYRFEKLLDMVAQYNRSNRTKNVIQEKMKIN